MNLIRLSGNALDQNNAAFTTVTTRINGARTLPRDWSAFGVALRQVDKQRTDLESVSPGNVKVEPPPALAVELLRLETGRPLQTIEGLPALSARVDTAISTAASWRAAWDRAERLKRIVAEADHEAVERAQAVLWESETMAGVRSATDQIDELVRRLAGGGHVPEQSGVAQRESVGTDSSVLLSPEAVSIRRKDALAIVVAVAIAVLGGMNAFFFGKPFGSVGDYAAVLAWALTASIAVDLASLALDRITLGNQGRPTRS